MDRSHILISPEKRLTMIERRFRQHHVDVQRLWKRIPQAPQLYGAPTTASRIPVDFDPESGGASAGGPVNTGGTRRCSRGWYRYIQCRWATRARNVVANGGNVSWDAPSEAEGEPDGTAAAATLGVNKRTQFLVFDRFGFTIPPDATFDKAVAHCTLKVTKNGEKDVHVPVVMCNQYGTPYSGAQGEYRFGPWFHRGGIRFAGSNSGWGSTVTSSEPGFWERTYFAAHDPPNTPNLMAEQDPLTIAEINSPSFGAIAQFEYLGATFGTGTVPTSATIHVDALRICIEYLVYHETGCSGEM